jgi:hypothetical protein
MGHRRTIEEVAMSRFDGSSFVRRALLLDAVVSGGTGILMALGAEALQRVLGLPAGLLRYAGIALVPFAALLVHLAGRERVLASSVWAVIIGNAAWVAASILVLLLGWIEPNRLGYAFVMAQAAAVAVLAEIEYAGLRRSAPVAG